MRYFKLLVGAHQEKGKKNYQAIEERDGKTGEITKQVNPIVPSEKNLEELFGNTKFVEVLRNEVPPSIRAQAEKQTSLLEEQADKALGGSDQDETPDVPAVPIEAGDEIKAAVEQGAKDIAPPKRGRDVTNQFPLAVKSELKVYLKPGGKYSIVDPDDNKTITSGGPIKKAKVEKFIEDYLET